MTCQSAYAMVEEHEAWKEMFDTMAKVFQVTHNELNDLQYGKVFEMIERWAYYDRERRKALKEEGNEFVDDFGVFFKGD